VLRGIDVTVATGTTLTTWLSCFMLACKPFSPPPDLPATADTASESTDTTTTPEPTADTATTVPTPTADTATTPIVVDLGLPALSPVNNGRFATSLVCADCHSAGSGTAMRDSDGDAIGAYDGWQATMMANAARDPLWRAVVSAEVAASPDAGPVIEATCMKCHAPMRRADTQLTGIGSPAIADLQAGNDDMHLALDGVSCAMCHQIEPDGLGTEEGFNGGYVVRGSGTIYGPYADPQASIMEQAVGFTPTFGQHIADSLVCATCHTVQTRSLNGDGSENGGQVLEQAPYLEWENSRWPGALGTCVSCHMPERDDGNQIIDTQIARNVDGTDDPTLPSRSPFRRHVLVGGNTLIPAILRDNADLLGVAAPPEAFDAVIAEAKNNLNLGACSVTLSQAYLIDGVLEFTATLEPQTGHKFPTGIPLRRTWLQTRVWDADGNLVLESGAEDYTGRIRGSDNAPLASEMAGGPIAPHYATVTSADEVPIYEAVLADVDGNPTYRLMQGAGFYKDNRLLPQGWSATHPNAELLAPVGVDGDPDWATAGDRVDYALPVGDIPRPITIEVEMRYQPLSPRFAAELFASGTPEAIAFEGMYEQQVRYGEHVATATTTAF